MTGRMLSFALAFTFLCSCAETAPPPLPTPESPAANIAAPLVQVDWEKVQTPQNISPSPNLDGGRWYDGATTDLIPGDDYGPLYPYIGTMVRASQTWLDDTNTQHTWIEDCLRPVYGLMDHSGKLVTDAAFQDILQATYIYGDQNIPLPALILVKTQPEWDEYFSNGRRYAVCARDGSWCTDFEFWAYTMNHEALLLIGPAGVTRLNPLSGERQDWSWESLNVTEEDKSILLDDLLWVYGFLWYQEGALLGRVASSDWENAQLRLFDPDTGNLSIISREEWEHIMDRNINRDWTQRNEWEYSRILDEITLTYGDESYTITVPEGLSILNHVEGHDDLVILRDYSQLRSHCWLISPSTGEVLEHAEYIAFQKDRAVPNAPAMVEVIYEDGSQILYDTELEPFLSYPPSSTPASISFSRQDGLIFVRDDSAFFACYREDNGTCVFYRNLALDE